MIGATALEVQSESAFGNFPAKQFVAHLQFIKFRRQFALRYQFQEKFQTVFVWRRNNRVGPLNPLALVIHAQGCVLPSFKLEWPARIHLYQPQILRQLPPFQNCRFVVLVARRCHVNLAHPVPLSLAVKNLGGASFGSGCSANPETISLRPHSSPLAAFLAQSLFTVSASAAGTSADQTSPACR